MFETTTLNGDNGPSLGSEHDPESVHFTVDPQNKLVMVKFGMKITAHDVARYATELKAHRDFEPTFAEIADLRDVKQIELQGPDFLKLADQIDPFSPKAKRAFLAKTPTQQHAARMHKILRGNKTVEIFQLVSDAMDWIHS